MKRTLGIFTAVCAAILFGSVARASTTYSIQPPTVAASPGDVGDAFDVVLTNNGPSSILVQSFAFEVSVTDADVTLTGADFSTGAFTYIFAGNSFDQNNFLPLNTTSGQTLDGSDGTSDGAGITLTSGQSLALGRVLFDISPTAATGPFTVSFTGTPAVGDSNNLTGPGPSFTPINVDSFSSGTITITSSSVPEPSSLWLVLGGMVAVAVRRTREARGDRRRQRS
jgi:PEP-CTERM motif